MNVIDTRGRLFGRINLVDAAIVGFLLVLIPLAYGTYVLFRPARPHIDSVTLAAITKEENRIAGGSILTAKLKVKGNGFNPMLRAMIGTTAALGFVFESPNSADVLVGAVGPNDHDLILLDGIQEVARSAGAYTIPASPPGASSFVRGVGIFLSLNEAGASQLKVGFKFPETSPDFEVLSLGRTQPARSSVKFAASEIDVSVQGLVEREAAVRIRCDSTVTDNPCAVGARALGPTVTLVLAGPAAPYQFMVSEVLPDAAPNQRARVRVRLEGGPHLASLKVGDRDAFLDERAAVITAVGSRTADALTVTLDLGLDEAREGWRYRAQRVKPGALFTLATERYEAVGRIESIDLIGVERRGGS